MDHAGVIRRGRRSVQPRYARPLLEWKPPLFCARPGALHRAADPRLNRDDFGNAPPACAQMSPCARRRTHGYCCRQKEPRYDRHAAPL
jgi:hypothetical protein